MAGRSVLKGKKMTFSTNYKPFMTYLTPSDIVRLKRFSKSSRTPMSQIVRDALSAKLASGDPYTSGFNAGLKKASDVVFGIEAAQMRFPSGLSFAELVDREVCKHEIPQGGDHAPDRES
jgi:hypothetical protein